MCSSLRLTNKYRVGLLHIIRKLRRSISRIAQPFRTKKNSPHRYDPIPLSLPGGPRSSSASRVRMSLLSILIALVVSLLVIIPLLLLLIRYINLGSLPITTESVAYDRAKYGDMLTWDKHSLIIDGKRTLIVGGYVSYQPRDGLYASDPINWSIP